MLFVDHFYNPELWRKMFRWFYVFPLMWNKRGQKQTTLCYQPKKLQKRENCLWTVLPCGKVARKNFLKSLLLGLIFKNYELKCLSTIITFCDNFSPCLFQPKIQQSDVYCTPITLLFVVLAWFKPPVIQ